MSNSMDSNASHRPFSANGKPRIVPAQVDERARGMRLLIVDDEPEICLLLKAMLEGVGGSCAMAHSRSDALRSLEVERFDGALVDINLPDGKGTDVIRVIKDNWPGVRVVAISAEDQESVAALGAGADAFLPKPLNRRAIFEGLDLERQQETGANDE